MKTSQVIWKALDHLKENGWVQGQFTTKDHKHCLRGALQCVMGEGGLSINEWNACQALMDTIQEHVAGGVRIGVASFNDRHAHTFDELTEVMEKTAIRLEEQGK